LGLPSRLMEVMIAMGFAKIEDARGDGLEFDFAIRSCSDSHET
jgi:hypothetical protein